jgi:hypothetical protein
MAECPFCKKTIGANDFLASEEASCPVCGKRSPSSPAAEPWWVSAAAMQSIQAKDSPAQPPAKSLPTAPANPEEKPLVLMQPAPPEPTVEPAAIQPKPTPTAAPAPPQATASKPPPPPPSVSADDDEPLTWLERVRALDLGSALAFLCFSMALLCASFTTLELFIKPLAALGLVAGLLGGTLPALWRGKKVLFPVLLSVLCLVVLLFMGRWPISSASPPRLVTVSLQQGGMAAHEAVSEDDWVLASTNAVKRGDVRVQIVSAQIGPVDLKRNGSVSASPERYLTIRVRVSYEGVIFQQTPYEPWADRADSPSKHPPALTDNHGHSYTQQTFAPGWKVAGRADLDALNPGHQVKEVLVYPVPPADAQHLRLMLPGSAFGLPGDFRFEIPRGMIHGL